MFVAWARKALSENGSRRYSWNHDFGEACACEPSGLGREKLTPMVKLARRVDGRPRSEVICRPAAGIRRCCIANAADPLGRVRFWRELERKREETLRTVDPDASPLLVSVYVGNGGWLAKEIAKTVPEPTDDERLLYDLFVWPGDTFDPATMVADRVEALAKARARVEAYKRGKRRGETPRAWAERERAEAEAAEAKRRADEAAARHRAWCDWVRSPPGTPPPGPAWADVPPRWAEARRVWLDFEAACAAGGRPSGDGWRPKGAEPRPPESALRASAATLGLRWPCSANEAKAAFRRLAIECHPDHAGDGATARMAQINVAYAELGKAFAA